MRSDRSHISPAKGWQLDYARLAQRRRVEHLIGFRLRAGFRFCHPYLLICRTDFLGHILWEQCVKISVNAQRSHLEFPASFHSRARSLSSPLRPLRLFYSSLCVGVKKLIFAATECVREKERMWSPTWVWFPFTRHPFPFTAYRFTHYLFTPCLQAGNKSSKSATNVVTLTFQSQAYRSLAFSLPLDAISCIMSSRICLGSPMWMHSI